MKTRGPFLKTYFQINAISFCCCCLYTVTSSGNDLSKLSRSEVFSEEGRRSFEFVLPSHYRKTRRHPGWKQTVHRTDWAANCYTNKPPSYSAGGKIQGKLSVCLSPNQNEENNTISKACINCFSSIWSSATFQFLTAKTKILPGKRKSIPRGKIWEKKRLLFLCSWAQIWPPWCHEKTNNLSCVLRNWTQYRSCFFSWARKKSFFCLSLHAYEANESIQEKKMTYSPRFNR